MNAAINTLCKFAASDEDFGRAHDRPSLRKMIPLFLRSSMDEVRLHHAGNVAREVLDTRGMQDLDHFRQGVLRRELARTISYQRQRDHSAHTLNNYLLGWYFFCRVNDIREEVGRHIDRRSSKGPVRGDHSVQFFADSWVVASLLHDIGYLFEGSVESSSPELQHQHVVLGSAIVDEYFRHNFWAHRKTLSSFERDLVMAQTNVHIPELNVRSLSTVADSLRSLGNLERVREGVLTSRGKHHEKPSTDYLGVENGLPGDAFELWRRHYAYFGYDAMAERIRHAANDFENILSRGLPDVGVRVLDHGVCSGLLMLQAFTFHARVVHGWGSSKPSDDKVSQVWKRFEKERSPSQEGRRPLASHWWESHVWATAATAVHNLLQSPGLEGEDSNPLELSDDPLAYLGVLVDCLQDWDRFSIHPTSVFVGTLPLQGRDVGLSCSKGSVRINFGDSRRKKAVSQELDRALVGWRKFVDFD